ncbi:putative E3 ubiquitin-protein ligase ring1a [Phtheirospermum japonicum]|uniref:Putative E3 ubiquitin-protein ligase ring1a n=1 Tax=Phtheirospermum japonicum TaxID=374723 RepID=A0A830CLR7_9LAMI|nr:putative E3 ubiquitin-protein ligase ring1a [Phtheirospermum japonicum]
MPAQKRPFETATPPPSPPPSPDEEKGDDSLQGSENHNKKLSDNISGTCLGIIRKTRTVMECLHRFCRECIDKSMRLGNNECPACRTHCASRRSLRDDPNYDALIAVLYPDIDKYEEEELAFHEEEKARNKQIQASISQTFIRQAEALGKKRTSARVTAGAFSRRQSNYRSLRGRRNHRVSENQVSDEEEVTNGSKDSSSADERSVEVKSKRYKKWGGARTSQQSSGANADDNDNDSEANRELLGGLIGGAEILAWGRGGMRSNTRHGGLGWANGKLSRNNRLSKLIDHLRCTNESDEELKISITLVSLLEGKIPSLKRPFLCCSPLSSVKHLCQYVAMQTSMEADKIEILTVKDFDNVNNSLSFKVGLGILNPCQTELQLLNEDQTLGEIYASLTQQNLVLTYRQKAQD